VLIGLGFIIVKFDIFLQEIGSVVNITLQDSAEHTALLLGVGVIMVSITLLVYALKNYLVGYREIIIGFHTPRNSIIYVSTIGVIAFSGMMIIYLILRVI
jgi:uncharacterized membrane protein YidH (DUF202 family)